MTATTTDTIAGICRAIDAGDDSLLYLADALEDAGDGRAEGVREIIARGWQPYEYLDTLRGPMLWFDWLPILGGRPRPGNWPASAQIPVPLLDRLLEGRQRYSSARYPTRSAAYLALAAAIVEGP